MFYDPRQNLYSRIEPSAEERLRRVSASYSLTVNCRNTKPIGVATGLLCGASPAETLVVDGPDVTVRWFRDDREQLRLIGRDVNRLLSGGFALQDVVLLGRRRLANTPLDGGRRACPTS